MWYRALALLALCLWPATSFGQVAYDNAGSATGAGVTSLSFSLTVSGSNRALLGSSLIYANSATPTGITYNAVSLTDTTSSTTGGTGSTMIANHRYLVAPATGANTLQCNYSSVSNFDLGCAAVSLTGVDQSSPVGTTATNFGLSTTPSVTVSSQTNGMVVDSVAIEHFGSLTVGSGQTSRWNYTASASYLNHVGSTEPGAASVVMDWSYGTSTNWANIATPFNPVSAGGSAGFLLRNMLGGGK